MSEEYIADGFDDSEFMTDAERARVRARASLIAAGEAKGADLGWAKRASRELGISEELALSAPRDVSLEIIARKMAKSERLTRWAASDPERAKKVLDTTSTWENLQFLFERMGDAEWREERLAELEEMGWSGVLEKIGEMGADVGRGYWEFLADSGKSFWNGTLDLPINMMASLRSIGEAGNFGDDDERENWRLFAERLSKGEELLESKKGKVGQRRGLSGFWMDVLNQIPQLGGSVAGYMTHPALGMSFMGSQIYGSSYRELTGMGIDPVNAAVGASINASLQMPLELIGATKLAKMLRGTDLRSLASLRRAMFAAGTIEGATEFAQKWPEYAGHTWAESSLYAKDFGERFEWFADAITDGERFARAFKEGLYEGALGFVMGGVGGAAGHFVHRKKLRAAAEEEQRIEDLAREIARESMAAREMGRAMEEARSRLGTDADPEASYEIIDKLIPEGYRKLFIDSDDLAALFHEEVTAPQEVLDALGVSAAEVNEALNGGAPLEVEAARVLSANNSRSGKVLDLLRLTPAGPTAGQSRDFHPDEVISEAMSALLGEEDLTDLPLSERKSEQARDLAHWKEMSQRASAEMARVKKEMREAGLSRHEIETNSALILAHAMSFYKTYGFAPDRLIRARFKVRGWTDSGEEVDRKLTEILGHDEGADGPTDSNAEENRGGQEETRDLAREEGRPDIDEAEAAAEALARIEEDLLESDEESADVSEAREETSGDQASDDQASGDQASGDQASGDQASDDLERDMEEEIIRAWEEEARREREAGRTNPLLDIDLSDQNIRDLLNFDPDAEEVADSGERDAASEGEALGEQGDRGAELGPGGVWSRQAWNEWQADHPDPEAEFGPDEQMDRETAAEYARRMDEKYPPGHPYHFRNEMDEPFEEIMDRLAEREPYEGPTIRAKPGRFRRGNIVMDQWKSIITLFRNRNIYTMQHEASHVYIDDLLRIASDDGSIAAANIMREIRRATTTKEGFDARAFADFAKAMAATRGTWQERFLTFKSRIEAQIAQVGDERAEAKTQLEQWRKLAEEREADPTGATRREETASYAREQTELYERKTARIAKRLSQLNRVGRAAERGLKHYDAIMEAREDVRLLARRAGIADSRLEEITRRSGKVVYRGSDPAIPDVFASEGEAYQRLQEWAARNFQAYLMEGRAPSRKLQGVFRRFANWLLNLYGSVRYWLGRDGVDPEIRAIFDRLLASRDQIAEISALETTAEMEAAFINNDQFTEAERRELKTMLEEARLVAQTVLERAKLEELEKFRRKALRRAKKEIAAEPFWKVAATAHINEADARKILGDKATNDLIQVSGRLIEGGADPAIVVQARSGDLWADPDAMLRDLHERLVINGETIDSLAEKKVEGEIDDLSKNIAEKIANEQGDAYEKYLEAVDETLWRLIFRRKFGKDPEEADRKARTLISSYQSIRAEAAQRLSGVPLGEISLARYQAMREKALRDREKAFRKGDLQTVMDAVRRARLASALMSEAREIRRIGASLRDMAGRTARAKRGHYPAYHTAAMDILLRNLGLGKMRGQMDASLEAQSIGWLLERIMGEETDDINGLAPAFGQELLEARLPPSEGFEGIFYDLDLEGLLEARNLLEWLRKDGAETGRQSRKLRENRAFACADACREAMAKLPDAAVYAPGTVRYRASRAIDRLYANIDALRWQTDKGDGLIRLPGKTDGSKDGGPLAKLFDKITDGENSARLDREDIGRRLANPVNVLAKSIEELRKRQGKLLRDRNGNIIPLPEQIRDAYSAEGWTGDRLIALALNCGTVQNMNRLMTGYTKLMENGQREFTLTYDMIAELLGDTVAQQVWAASFSENQTVPGPPNQGRNGLLSREDWLAIQQIWDVLASRWGDLSRAHLELYGFMPEKVKVDGLKVTGANGELIQLKGGYYPLRYDGAISSRVGRWNEMDDLLNRNDALFQRNATAKKGMTKKRAEKSPRLPVKFDTSILSEHINDVATFIHLARPVRDYNDVIRRPEFKKTYISKFGRDDYEAIASNLRGVLRREPGVANSDVLTSLANTLRPYLVYWGLSWNLKVAALQSTAVFPAMGDLGVRPMIKSIMWMTKNGPSALKQIHQVSPYMKSRMHNLDQDLRRAIDQLSFKKKASVRVGDQEISWEDFVQLGMSPIIMVDAAATGAVWAAAYNVKMAEAKLPPLSGRDRRNLFATRDKIHEEAVKFADNMVKASNPDYDASSRSAFLRVNNAARLVNGFASAITLFAQRGRQMTVARKKGLLSFPEYARFFAYEYLAPAVFFGLAISLARGVGPWDEPEEFTSNMLSSLMDFYTMRIPIFGSTLGDLALELFDIKHQGFRQGGPRTTIDQPYQLAGNFVSQARKVLQGEDSYKDLAMATADILSFASRVPISKLARNAEKGWDQYLEGKGTLLSPFSPRPGKTSKREKEILYGIFD